MRLVMGLVCILAAACSDEVMSTSEAGSVSRARTQGWVISGEEEADATPGMTFALADVLAADEDGRIEARLRDGTVLTIGAGARTVIDTFVYDPAFGKGALTVRLSQGCLRLLSGNVSKNRSDAISVETPVASLGLRGTEVWIGEIDGSFGALLLDGEMIVITDAGRVVLDEVGEGTTVFGRDQAPSDPVIWPQEKYDRALALTDF